jgi:dihydrolipoamide dehydrogenase
MEQFDVTVIGAGPGGYPAAIRAAQLGAKVALIEKEQLGGTCLNWGCIPTKTLIASADLYHRARTGAALGVAAEKTGFDYGRMIRRKDEVVATLQGGVGQLCKANGVTVYNGRASFVSRNRLRIDRAAGASAPRGAGRAEPPAAVEIGSKKVIIATGSTSTMPGFLPQSANVVESRAFLDRTMLPDSMLVLGGGVIGCEFACMAARLGVAVTLVELLEDILLVCDADVIRAVRRRMENELGIRILTGRPMERIRAGQHGVAGAVGGAEIEAELLLAAVGRSPVTDGLALERAGLSTDARGYLPVDAAMQTRTAGVYAVGDVTAGSTQLAHAATAQGMTAAENAVRGGRAPAETLVPACIFTAPEIGAVGVTEKGARERGLRVTVGTFMLAGLGKAMAAGETDGFVKWIADADTDQLLGAHAVGAHATEWIAEAAVAIRAELTAEELGRAIHCHPTFGEAWMEAAHAVHGTCIHQPPKRKR